MPAHARPDPDRASTIHSHRVANSLLDSAADELVQARWARVHANSPRKVRSKLPPSPEPTDVAADSTGGLLSPAVALHDSVVLLTGVTGYLGSLMLELILRTCPTVSQVKVVIRSKAGQASRARLQALWEGPVFRKLDPALQNKVEVLDADIAAKHCGLTAQQCRSLDSVQYIIHCASNIRFDLPVQKMLAQNFAPTQELALLAAQLPNLRCFTYMSTAFVNANQPKDTVISERTYNLYDLGGGLDTDGAMATRLSTMPPELANRQAAAIMRLNRLRNTYFLSKSLTERMLLDTQLAREGKLCIVRPSIVGAVAHQPCPGYVGNSSGFTALILGAASGVIQFTSHNPESVVPLVPGDVVANITLAASICTAHVPGEARTWGPIVHACTSTTSALGSRRVHSTLSAYFNEDRPLDNTLVRGNRPHACRWLKSDAAFAWASFKHGMFIQVIAAALRVSGNPKASHRLKLGWKTWRQLGSRKFDVNLTFTSDAARQLQSLMQPQSSLKLVWEESGGDSWLRYLRTYAAGVRHLYRKELPGVTDQQDYRVL